MPPAIPECASLTSVLQSCCGAFRDCLSLSLETAQFLAHAMPLRGMTNSLETQRTSVYAARNPGMRQPHLCIAKLLWRIPGLLESLPGNCPVSCPRYATAGHDQLSMTHW
jgi:hypothetical protein